MMKEKVSFWGFDRMCDFFNAIYLFNY